MRKTTTPLSPRVNVMEPRLLLTTAAPLLTRYEVAGVVRDLKAIVTTLARTDDTDQASTELSALSSQVPSGSPGLGLTWQIDLGLYRPHSQRSMVATQRRMVNDLYRAIQEGVDTGNNGQGTGSGTSNPTSPTGGNGGTGTSSPSQNPGHGTTGSPTPTPSPALDSVLIQNTTGLAIVVTIELEVPQVQQPRITETIPAQGDTMALFNFGTSTGDFMTMDVSLAGGGQSPPPFDNANLSQPMNGYNGTVFTISLFGPYFTVNVP